MIAEEDSLNSTDLFDIMRLTEALLLDFDGPICSVFAGLSPAAIASDLREVLIVSNGTALPDEVLKTEDPFRVLQYAAIIGVEEAARVEEILSAREVTAVATAEPTPGAHELIRAWKESGRKLGIVSNNSENAVKAYLSIHGLSEMVDVVAARSFIDPGKLKPDPYLLKVAASALDVKSDRCTLVGDSVSDIQAAEQAAMNSIAYVNKIGKGRLFARIGVKNAISSIAVLMSVM